jgi:DNA-binding transcriptional ArsR family regulator
MPNQSAGLDRVFHALCDPTRRAIVSRLSRGPASVGELAQPVAMALPSLLQHLAVLEESRLIRTAKVGRRRMCEMRPSTLGRAAAWIAQQRAIWEGRADRMEAYLSELQRKDRKHAKRRADR